MLLLRDGWSHGKVHTWPYRWLDTAPGELLENDIVDELEATFPIDGFERKDASGRVDEKRYQNFSRNITPVAWGKGGTDSLLPDLWRKLVEDLCGIAYRRRVAELLDQEVADRVELRLVRHTPGDWLDPHTDRPDKLFSHILYFNRGWQASWGGCLHILSAGHSDASVTRVVPRLGASALMARSDHSWHAVTPVAGGIECTRASLLVHGARQ